MTTHRKARGAFFTPAALCDHIAGWAVRDPHDSVLEPACGEAAFLLAASRRLQALGGGRDSGRLRGVELHAPSAAAAGKAVGAGGTTAEITVADFFSVEAHPEFDAVIGNPPYVRYQNFHGEARARARTAALRAGVRLSNLAGSWAAFTVHASLFLQPTGRLGLVLPAELLSVNYAAPVRQFLLERFRHVQLVLFTERVFPGVQEEVVLLLAEGAGPTDRFEVHQIRDLAELAMTPTRPAVATPSTSTANPTANQATTGPQASWMSALISVAAHRTLLTLTADGLFVTLATWGRTTLGAVTGNNRYFALSRDRAYALGLGDDELVPISPPGSRHLRALTLSNQDWRELTNSGLPTLLFRPGSRPSPAARAYLAEGERAEVDQAYKCRVRSPWWQVPLQPEPADLLLTYMNAHTPQLATNLAAAAHLNSVHGVALEAEHRRTGRDLLPLAALNSVTMLGAETVGRAYGGGMLKLEPREAARLLVPAPELVERLRPQLSGARRTVARALAAGRLVDAVAVVDEVLLTDGIGLSRGAHEEVAAARYALWFRRNARASRSVGGTK
ncbi:N-6 DNA methylase [Frankia sp. Cppng1_Ct_nod]|uniref:N-6 DNA methylase n=1 Tax=Frankia sp. Cppng1_Ct_nod TaxID=2897162 RepID=UPI002023F2A9|nr:N-6 DNA methylase [Frankia sp. Cppng1_Ct_nod]